MELKESQKKHDLLPKWKEVVGYMNEVGQAVILVELDDKHSNVKKLKRMLFDARGKMVNFLKLIDDIRIKNTKDDKNLEE